MNLIEADRACRRRLRRPGGRRRGRGLAVDGAVTPASSKVTIESAAGLRADRMPAADTLTAVAELIRPMGAETLVHARGAASPGHPVVLPRERRAIGEPASRCDPRRTCLAASGRRCGRDPEQRPSRHIGGHVAGHHTAPEYSIIGLGLAALALIFQPFSLALMASAAAW
jgi:hypothetical protein